MRIAAKHLRYILQACTPFYLDAVQEPARTAHTFQTLLGDIHDGDVWAHDLPLFLEEESPCAARIAQGQQVTIKQSLATMT